MSLQSEIIPPIKKEFLTQLNRLRCKNGKNLLADATARFEVYCIIEDKNLFEDDDKMKNFISELNFGCETKDTPSEIIFSTSVYTSSKENSEKILSLNRDGVTMTKSAIACRRCKGRNVDGVELQTRAADEEISRSYKCRDCGEVWRVS